MINVYPTKVVAYDVDTNELIFTMDAVDEHAATVVFKGVIGPDNVNELTAALRSAVQMLELK